MSGVPSAGALQMKNSRNVGIVAPASRWQPTGEASRFARRLKLGCQWWGLTAGRMAPLPLPHRDVVMPRWVRLST